MQAAPSTRHPRSSDRFGLVLPITLEGEEGSTHDVSATGILLELHAAPPVGSDVALMLQYEAGGVEHQLACRGEVIRVEPHGDSFNIAVRLSKPLFAEGE
jgi:hypothetical protein